MTALVVGASSDIGRATAVALAPTHPDLVLWGRDPDRLAAAGAAVEAAGARARTARVDVTDAAAVRSAVADATATGPLRCVVWAAGTFVWGPAADADPDDWTGLLDVNLTAAARLTALVLPHLVAAAPSALVLVGSGAARQAYPSNAAYVASKHGLAGLAAATFLDVRDAGVKVSLVSPGLVAAGAGLRAPAAPRLLPEDVAEAVRWVVAAPARCCPVEVVLQPQPE